MPLIITLPLIAVLAVVMFAMGVKFFSPKPAVVVTKPNAFPDSLSKSSEVGKPASFLGSLFGQVTNTPTPVPATSAELSKDLKDTYDDGGQSDLDALSRDAGSL